MTYIVGHLSNEKSAKERMIPQAQDVKLWSILITYI